MGKYKVGIILPVYNAQNTIKKSIESILNQTYKEFTLYVIDDASTDNTKSIINEYLIDARVKIITHEFNRGASEARNLGLISSDEPIVCFIDSDDIWHKDKLSLQVKMLTKGYDLIFTRYEYIKSTSTKDVRYISEVLKHSDFLRKKYRVCFSSVCFKRPVDKILFKHVGHEDFLFLNSLFEEYEQAYIVDKILVKHNIVEGSLSSHKGKASLWHYKVLRIIYPNNPLYRTYLFLCYMINAILFRVKK